MGARPPFKPMATQALIDAIKFHAFFMGLGPLIFGANLFWLGYLKNYATLNKRLYAMMVIVFMWVAIGFFSGVFIWAMQGFSGSLKVVLMVIALGLISLGEIQRIKKLKHARIKEAYMQKYIRWSQGLYTFNLLLSSAFFIPKIF
ncbi:hypothetical protein [Helicobacter bizzozeronii]|uniref:hypothetical protein n=1 Tax=Helicobacter bizzozeronii TaxID=56877 RepID=UPI000CF0690F|nr:hypothetical protein [Helicobacter bizzozeronii]